MAIHVALEHLTDYRYDRPVRLSPQVIRLRPAPHTRTPILDYRLEIHPPDHHLHWQQDPFGNFMARAEFPNPTDAFRVGVYLVADMTVINPFDFYVEQYAEYCPFRYDTLLRQALAPYLRPTESGPRIRDWLAEVFREKRLTNHFLFDLNARLQRDIGYTIRLEPGIQSCEETFTKGTGSCRDTAWLLVQILRHLGLAARFASGYLIQLKPDVKPLEGPAGPDRDFTDLHAWSEVYLPGAGWVGLDPTSGLFAGEGHIPLACAPHPVAASPITGFTDECKVKFRHRNRLRRVCEDARVTKPYTRSQWSRIRSLALAVDQNLKEWDVRLTLGGEPTFVAVDDMEGEEWNTSALGPTKKILAGRLLRCLWQAFAPGGLIQHCQGKWYPAEPLPRWALACYWRTDGVSLWQRPELLADENHPGGADLAAAYAFGERLAAELGLAGTALTEAFEDWRHYLKEEVCRPPNLDWIELPGAAGFRDDLSLALGRGLDRPVGYILPLTHRHGWHAPNWQPSTILIPGSSPMGLRLPLEQLPPELPKTALCLEPRGGHLCLFLPPLDHWPAWLELIAAVEAAAAALDLPVILEGEPPPAGAPLKSFKITPDPGVIETNVQPAIAWEELEVITETLYQEAHRVRLGTEKYLLDGRHTGTGGGNHLTLGGPTPNDSPFLRRPDLLASLITYWQHHPALSYFFAGLFLGPTSQAPRADERGGDLEALQEALDTVREAGEAGLIDALLRHHLCDATGNTHRSEFSIDKLWAQDTPGGCQGLVELRAFEMPPHPRMSLLQMLLVRALVGWFWETPYKHPLIPWSTQLHDRFMLAACLWADLAEVMEDLQRAGYPFDLAWFEPFLEFRFPHLGQARIHGVEIELRTALEPWPVLEEPGDQGQTRAVDAAVERVEVRVSGLDVKRFLVTCNRRRLPLQPVGSGLIAGVRFRAWPAPLGRHPTVPVHSTLVFDLFDRKLGRSVGGCAYHVAHPGGRAYEGFPVNAYEAEARRVSRFWTDGHTPGRFGEPPPEPAQPAFPFTLDLRRRFNHD